MEHLLGRELHRTANKVRRQQDRISGRCGLPGGQGIVLCYLCQQEAPVYQKDVERFFDIRRSTASGLLKGLEQSGCILRQGGVAGDARLRRVLVTERGQSVRDRVAVELDRYEHALLSCLTPQEQTSFFTLLARIADAAERSEKWEEKESNE